MSEGGKKAKQMASSSHLGGQGFGDQGFGDQDFDGDSTGDDKTVFVMKAMKQCELNTHDEDSLFGDSPNTVCKVECRSEMRNRNWC